MLRKENFFHPEKLFPSGARLPALLPSFSRRRPAGGEGRLSFLPEKAAPGSTKIFCFQKSKSFQYVFNK